MSNKLMVNIFVAALGFTSDTYGQLQGENASLCTIPNSSRLKCCVGYFERSNLCLKCPDGTFGLNCSDICSEGFYGPGCSSKCQCKPNEICYPATGCTPLQGNIVDYSSPKSLKENAQYALDIHGQRFSISEILTIFLLVLILILVVAQMAIGRIRSVKKHITAALDGEVRRRQVFIPNRTFASDDWSDNEFQMESEIPGLDNNVGTDTCQKTVYRSLASDNPYTNFEEQQEAHNDRSAANNDGSACDIFVVKNENLKNHSIYWK